MASRLFYDQVLSHFPRHHIRLAFAYGSGVFQQWGHKDMSKNMLDFIFVVDNPIDWHTENIQRNSSHYSALKYLSVKQISQIQEKFGAKVYFNTLVPCDTRLIKYGVISKERFLDDMFDWETLYISGRLHKPVSMFLHNREDTDIQTAILTNYQSAIHTALLLLPDSFTEEELFCTVAGLSYSGDFRMTVGEDKNKVRNIVKPSIEQFRDIYGPILDGEDHIHWNKRQGTFEQSLSFTSHYHHLNLLPKMLQLGLLHHRNKDGCYRDMEEILKSFSTDPDCKEILQRHIHTIVQKSSFSQSFKSIFTAGVLKSIRYSWSKLKKMWKSKK